METGGGKSVIGLARRVLVGIIVVAFPQRIITNCTEFNTRCSYACANVVCPVKKR